MKCFFILKNIKMSAYKESFLWYNWKNVPCTLSHKHSSLELILQFTWAGFIVMVKFKPSQLPWKDIYLYWFLLTFCKFLMLELFINLLNAIMFVFTNKIFYLTGCTCGICCWLVLIWVSKFFGTKYIYTLLEFLSYSSLPVVACHEIGKRMREKLFQGLILLQKCPFPAKSVALICV